VSSTQASAFLPIQPLSAPLTPADDGRNTAAVLRVTTTDSGVDSLAPGHGLLLPSSSVAGLAVPGDSSVARPNWTAGGTGGDVLLGGTGEDIVVSDIQPGQADSGGRNLLVGGFGDGLTLPAAEAAPPVSRVGLATIDLLFAQSAWHDDSGTAGNDDFQV
jgi:hypothetical protein